MLQSFDRSVSFGYRTISLPKDKFAPLARLFSIRSSSWIILVCTLAGNLNADGVRLQFTNFDLIVV